MNPESPKERLADGRRARAIAFYLPQFYPTPENDEWWGPGFTEWTNVIRAVPQFDNHYQPRLPGELGFYDLRVPEVRSAQADLARAHGIEAFCYWHYWFGDGRTMLDRPLREVLSSGEPDFPFCVGWANHSWAGVWQGAPKRLLIEQTYPGPDDDRRHFNDLVATFHDPRYIRVDDKPLLVVHRPEDIPDPQRWMERKTAIRQLTKLLPRSISLAMAAQVDEAVGRDLQPKVIVQQLETS